MEVQKLAEEYPRSYELFDQHMRTNCVGPIMTAQKLLQIGMPIGVIMFMSSDSGSATTFRGFEDGYLSCIDS